MFEYLQQRAQQLPHQFWRRRLGELVVELKHEDERHYLTLDGDGVRLNLDNACRRTSPSAPVPRLGRRYATRSPSPACKP